MSSLLLLNPSENNVKSLNFGFIAEMSFLILSFGLFVLLAKSNGYGYEDDDVLYYDTFPEDFQWGYATASYQIEGAWNVDGKGENIWDEYSHRIPSKIDDGSNGDIACDSYHKYEEDIKLLKAAGAQTYRFSISWSRILPTGKIDKINEKGIEYYNNLTNALIANGIEPMITLYHWDLPQTLQNEYGGWPNEALIQHFVDFADLAFKTFGDRVKQWITFNEPFVICYQGYGNDGKAPGFIATDLPYNCTHTIIKAHAATYRIYLQLYRPTQNGKVGITLSLSWYEPENASDIAHIAAADRALQFDAGWFFTPLVSGKYPDVMEPFTPQFTVDEANEIRNTWDFLGINHYSTDLVRPKLGQKGEGWEIDQANEKFKDPSCPTSSATWLAVVPWGFRKLLNWLKDTYDNPEIYITENGFADFPDTGVSDTGRVDYYREYINQMLKAVKIDNVKVTKYTAWSLLDNFEWKRGYSQRFGTHSVDFQSSELTRTPKESVALLKKIFTDNGFVKASSAVTKFNNNCTIFVVLGVLCSFLFV